MTILDKGIDISKWQGDFDLEQAKAEGFSFAVIKGGGGDSGLYTDSKFVRNYDNAKRLGMPVGVYWFSKALTVEEALKEAEYFYEKCLKGRQFNLPVYMDVEHKSQLALGKRALTDIIHAWCQALEEKGFWVGIYSSQSYFSDYMIDSELQCYAHWVARWSKSCDYRYSSFGMWQYGGETNPIRSNKVAGVVCDQDYLLIDYPSLIKRAGKNGFGAAPQETVTLNLPVLCKGDRGEAVRALQILLTALGYACGTNGKYNGATENAVECYQEDNGLPVTGTADSATWTKLLGG